MHAMLVPGAQGHVHPTSTSMQAMSVLARERKREKLNPAHSLSKLQGAAPAEEMPLLRDERRPALDREATRL
jgi:hypothetical protein